MIIAILAVVGVILGSFVNALVWRLRKQDKIGKKTNLEKYSILRGRSMCSNCEHQLQPIDLVPIFSWLFLGGKCRYCKKPIKDTPFSEIVLPSIFVLSYFFMGPFVGAWSWVLLSIWLAISVVLLALFIYDWRWMELPNNLVIIGTILSAVYLVLQVMLVENWSLLVWPLATGVMLAGFFAALFYASDGRWLGGGDVKMSFMLGLLAGTPEKLSLLLLISSITGLLCVLPLALRRQASRETKIAFGPHLVLGTLIVVLVGQPIMDWYFSILIG